MKNLLFTALANLLTITLTSAQPTIEWQKCFGGTNDDCAHSIQQTNDGGYIVAGYSSSNDGDVSVNYGLEDSWLLKLDNLGTIEWEKSLNGSDYDVAWSIQQTNDGGYIVVGESYSTTCDVTGVFGFGYYWVIKLSGIGILEWQRCLGGSSIDEGKSIQQTTDGGYIVAGYSSSNDGDVSGNHGLGDFWVVKLTSIGNIEWQKSLGGTASDEAYFIQQTNDGGYIVAGRSGSNDGDVSGNHGSMDYWVVKLSSTGIISWQKSLGGTGTEIPKSIQQTIDGGYIVAGYSSSNDGDVSGNHGDYDYWVVKLTSIGSIEWQKSLGGTGDDQAYSIQQTNDGGYIIAGYTYSNDGDISNNIGFVDTWLVKLNSLGSIEWQKSYGGTGGDAAFSIKQTIDGGYIVAGCSESNDGDVSGHHGEGDFWVVKLSSSQLSIENSHQDLFSVFPNPAKNTINIKADYNLIGKAYSIYDNSGKIVLSGKINSENTLIEIGNLSGGIYLFSVGENLKQTFKVIKQ